MHALNLLLMLALPAAAQDFPPCVTKDRAPASYEALLKCQKKQERAFIRKYQKENSQYPPDEVLDRLDDFQSREAAAYQKRRKASGSDKNANPDLGSLDSDLKRQAGDGSKGITPEMADEIRQTLRAKQGNVSPDMDQLLNSVEKDGGKLTPETMDQLKGASQKAEEQGLDLNVDPKVRAELKQGDEK